MFVFYNNKVVNVNDIVQLSLDNMEADRLVIVKRIGFTDETVSGEEAINLISKLCPEAFLDDKLSYIKYSWAFHNIIAHPLMEILSWIGLEAWGNKLHELTIPKPKLLGA